MGKREHSFKEKIRRYIVENEQQGELISRRSILSHVGMTLRMWDHRYSGLTHWVDKQVEGHKERYRKRLVGEYNKMVEPIIIDLKMEYGAASIERVVERLGVLGEDAFRAKYPEVITHIKEINLKSEQVLP